MYDNEVLLSLSGNKLVLFKYLCLHLALLNMKSFTESLNRLVLLTGVNSFKLAFKRLLEVTNLGVQFESLLRRDFLSHATLITSTDL